MHVEPRDGWCPLIIHNPLKGRTLVWKVHEHNGKWSAQEGWLDLCCLSWASLKVRGVDHAATAYMVKVTARLPLVLRGTVGRKWRLRVHFLCVYILQGVVPFFQRLRRCLLRNKRIPKRLLFQNTSADLTRTHNAPLGGWILNTHLRWRRCRR